MVEWTLRSGKLTVEFKLNYPAFVDPQCPEDQGDRSKTAVRKQLITPPEVAAFINLALAHRNSASAEPGSPTGVLLESNAKSCPFPPQDILSSWL